MSFSVDDVIQHAAYDPQARHERYLKKRQLKGRRPAVAPKVGQGSRIVDAIAPMSTIHTSQAHQDAMAAQRASNARQISQIQGRLDGLKSHLKELLAQQQKAKASSSSSSKSSTSTATKSGATTKTGTGSTKPQTAKQKEAAKENVKKAQQASAAKKIATPDQKPSALPLEDQIVKTRAVISVVEAKLKTAIEQSSTKNGVNGR